MNKKVIILLIIISMFSAAAYCRSRDQLQEDLINNLVATPQNSWNQVINKSIGLIDDDFLKICVNRIRYAMEIQRDFKQAYIIATIADKIALMINDTDDYRIRLAFSYFDLKNYNESINVCNALDSVKPKDPFVKTLLGFNYYKLKETQKAENYFNEAVALAQNNPLVYFYIGTFFKNEYNEIESKKYYSKASELDPKFKKIIEDRSKNEDQEQQLNPVVNDDDPIKQSEACLKDNNFDKAKQILNDYIKQNPSSFKAYLLLGKAYLLTNDFKISIDNFEKAKAINSQSADLYFYIGYDYEHIYQNSKNIKDLLNAKSAYEQSFKLDPDYMVAIEAVKRIDSILKSNKK